MSNVWQDEEDDWDDDGWDEDDATLPCPECGAELTADAEVCPACGFYIIDSETSIDGSERDPGQPRWIIMTAGVVLVLILAWYLWPWLANST